MAHHDDLEHPVWGKRKRVEASNSSKKRKESLKKELQEIKKKYPKTWEFLTKVDQNEI